MLNVIHFAPAYTNTGGGICEAVSCIAKSQSDAGFCIKIISPDDPKFEHINPELKYETLAILPYQGNYKKTLKFYVHFVKLLQRCDVLHIHGGWSLQFLYLFPWLFLCRNKIIIFQPHGLLGEKVSQRKKYVKKILWWVFQRYITLKSTKIIFVSEEEEDQFYAPEISSCKSVIIGNGISDQFFTRSEITERANDFLFLSQITKVKGIENLLDAFAMLHQNGFNYNLTVAGYGNHKYVRELQKRTKFLGIENHVKFIGRVKPSERCDVYDTHKFFILPSFSEGFGLVVGEALARGCITFVSENVPWAREQKALSSLNVMATDPHSMAVAIMEVLSKYPSESSLESDKMQATIKENYSWSISVYKITKLYEECFENAKNY